MPRFSPNIIPNTPAELRIFVSVLYQNIATLEKEINDLKAVQPDYTPVVRGTDGNIPIFGGNPNMQGMDRGLFLDDAYKAPTAAPAGGIFIYSDAGVFKIRTPTGTTTLNISKGTGSATTAGTAITFSPSMSTGYVLWVQCYTSQNPYATIGFNISSKTNTGFTLTPLANSTYEYIAIG